MQFIPNGPSIPDELLVARDAGDVIFFCGAGVSQHEAGLPNFEKLGRNVIELLGAAQDSPARSLLVKALEMGRMAGVGGLLATDRVFGLLEREFEVADVRAAVAEAITPEPNAGLGAHRTLLTLATSRNGVTRLVTTNFDLLFEACDPDLPCSGPPQLPDPRSDREFRGVVHLHGRVDIDYRRPADEEFIVSSADFGRAYLSDGWATRFIQSLLSRFQIVFVGYTAEDPPVQYLLEALNLEAGTRNRLYAFQDGESEAAEALWEHKGVQAIPFDSSDGVNLASLKTHGFDFEASYRTSLGNAGDLSLQAIATYVPTYALQSAPGGAFVNVAGNRNTRVTGGAISPEWRGMGRINWSKGRHAFSTVVNYYGGIANDFLVTSPGDVKAAEDFYLSGTATVDFAYTYDVGSLWKANDANITLGVRNAFQSRPELPSYDRPLFVDQRGRIAYIRLVAGF